MKKIIIAFALQMVVFAAVAQTNPVRIVFDITSKDTLAHQGALRHMALMAKVLPSIDIRTSGVRIGASNVC